ncbi:diacylglycerol lipase-beta-like isoform X2 [Littorina saxatilis]|uniref:diacylglycerol lipase-beta-like isoform X2 n=1 Tax=Littorina saxatilis TaxID=31220 RepID=UPI0038B63190
MPGIHMLKRNWAIGSDDFVFPSLAEFFLRLSWLLVISILLGIHHGSFTCPNGYLLRDYYIGTIVLLSIGILNSLAIMVVSMRGTIRDSRPRRHVSNLLYAKAIILIPEAVWIILATYWAFGVSFSCDWTVVWAAKGAVICAWIVGFWMFVGILLVFDPLGSAEHRLNVGDTMSKKGSEYLIHSSKSKNMHVWETRCRCLCCCIAHSQDNDTAFSDVSKLVADFFKGVDLVPTDIAAGLMLVAQQQEHIEADLSAIIINPPQSNQSGSAALANDSRGEGSRSVMINGGVMQESWMTIPMMTHYMKFALGSYGWPFYMYSNLFTGLCRLCASCSHSTHNLAPSILKPYFRGLTRRLTYMGGGRGLFYNNPGKPIDPDRHEFARNYFASCCACMRPGNNVHSDNICECHTAAIKRLTKVRDQDLIYVSFHNRYREIPFYVAVDRKYNNVVISIRGTLSLQDALTDLSARGVPLLFEGVPDATCHDAMLDCAKFIKSTLESKHLLEKAFSSLQEESRLVIVGHSLGAGAAAILSVLLKPQYNNLACFAYSPPGGLMSRSASLHVRDFVCSVIVGEDIVPRLGMPSMCDLKVKVLRALCESNTPKHKILATGCFRMLCQCGQFSDSSLENTGEVSPLTDSRPRRYSTTTSPLQDALRAAEEYANEMQHMEWPMHPPGQILHIVELEENKTCGKDPQYTAVWAQPEDFSTILISSKMIMDHFPDVVMRALCQLEDKNFVPSAHRVSAESGGKKCCYVVPQNPGEC